MAKKLVPLYGNIPDSLAEADEVLQRYGRWAVSVSASGGRCGSAEGNYQPPGGQALEARRAPLELMSNAQALRVQQALQAVDAIHRVVLTILYVPRKSPIEAQLRLIKTPPRLAQVRHLEGLRRFWPRFQLIEQQALDKDRAVSLYNAPTSQLV